MRVRQETVEQMAARLWNYVDRPVKDATGLKRKYDYTLYWAIDRGAVPLSPPDPNGAASTSPADADNGPTIFTAIQAQLGLKLQPKKGPVEILVVDHAEKVPTEN